jgi:hypothetical protein
MSKMTEMSQAIRLQIEKDAPTLHDIPDEILAEYVTIVGAFYFDLKGELERRGA